MSQRACIGCKSLEFPKWAGGVCCGCLAEYIVDRLALTETERVAFK